MRTLKIDLFKFSELNEAAKKAALENVRHSIINNDEFNYSEYKNSLDAFANDVGVGIVDYCYGIDGCSVDLDFDDLRAEYISGVRLYTWIVNNVKGLQPGSRVYTVRRDVVRHGFKRIEYVFKRVSGVFRTSDCCNYTGFFCDETLLKPFREFLRAPTDEICLGDLVRASIDAYCTAMLEDLEYQESDAYALEYIENNGDDLEFLAHGKIYE